MRTRLATGPAVRDALAEALAGGPAVAIAERPGAGPASWRLDGPPLEADASVLVGTSGSTGEPKGVLLTAASIRASVAATHERLGGPGHWVCPLPVHYVAGLMTAARAAVAGTEWSMVPPELSELPVHAGRNYASVVAAQLHRALAAPPVSEALSRFDAVLVGGSAVPADLLRRARTAGVRVIATYGMAETCGGCVYDGVPLPGVQVRLAEDDRIHLAGPMVFAGYRLDPGATEAALSGRTLRTSDRGRWRDGRLQVLGRMDEVVITGGMNVDLGAARRASDAEFGPGRLTLLAVPDARWGVRIVAATDLGIDLDECRRRLATRLQPAALPRELRQFAGLPRTSTGKIDEHSLRQLWAGGS